MGVVTPTRTADRPAPSTRAAADPKPPAPAGPPRVASIDAYRGAVMLLLMASVLRFDRVAAAHPDSQVWGFLAHHQTHAAWIGCSLHDLIQPSFIFVVGAAVPFSLGRRATDGQPEWVRTLHAFWRALVLILLGVFLSSTQYKQTNWVFMNTLSQIGLAYGFVYLLALRSRRTQWAAVAVLLGGYWLAFALSALPGADFDWKAAGVSPTAPEVLSGFAAHWGMNTNLAWRFDTWFLNQFPREKPFQHHPGGYATLNFVPTVATMALGLLAGGVLRSDRPAGAKVRWLVAAGVVGLAAGYALGAAGVCPVVKRIWTPSWALFSGGWCLLILAAGYLVLDIGGYRRWAFPLAVVGANSIAAYLIVQLLAGYVREVLLRHLGGGWGGVFGKGYEPLIQGMAVLLVEWLILLWMYRRRIYLRI